jgi:hypothetical protein
MSEIQATLSKYPIKTRLSLSGTLVVARDIAHAKLKERLDNGQGLPQYIKDHIIYYAGTSPPPATLPHDTTNDTPSRSRMVRPQVPPRRRRVMRRARSVPPLLVAWCVASFLVCLPQTRHRTHADGQICDNRTRTWTCS